MHLSVRQSQSIDDADTPVNPEQSPADMLVLSFTDSDLACMGAAYRGSGMPSLRLTSLAPLKHPLSVDLYLGQVAAHAKVIVVRLLGGYEWWRYGAQELSRVAREKHIALIMVPGDARVEPQLTALSTVPADMVRAVDACLAQGGVANALAVLEAMAALAGGVMPNVPVAGIVEAGGLYREACAANALGYASIIFYRAHYLAADTAPIDALLDAFAQRGISARAFMVSSLKDPAALAALRQDCAVRRPDILIDVTAFSAGEGAHPLADMGAPVLQCALANMTREAWLDSPRGLGTTDLAMHIVLPEADGRVFTRAISFKAEAAMDDATQFRHVAHHPEDDRVGYVAELSAAWVRLGKKTAADKSVAFMLSDYPDRAGRSAYSVGLDGPQSAVAMLRLLRAQGYAFEGIPDSGEELLSALQGGAQGAVYTLPQYRQRLAALPLAQQEALAAAWGEPESDVFFRDGAFRMPVLRCGKAIVALQPDRGSAQDRKSGYHDAVTPPRHGYLAFYWWLRDVAAIDAMVHVGTHGNLEWLPGKSVALTAGCWPEIALGATPVVYPYIVSDPGEAAQAKRRIAAVTLSHLTPPLMPVTLAPGLAALEALVDEYGSADGLDGRRMKLLRDEIIHRARRAGLPGDDDNALMATLETHLCDIKEQRVGDGLHVFGQAPSETNLRSMADALHGMAGGRVERDTIGGYIMASAAQENVGLMAALDGKFIMPGPGGSPVRGRLDIMPTGRNMVTIDPRTIPTRTATTIGHRAADEFIRRYVQDHGDWPRSVVIDVWGSATLRNGGDDIAQALHLMGVTALWDDASSRVAGFDITPACDMAWPRVDVALRVSGLFRDMFANLIMLFDDAVKAVAALDEDETVNPLAAGRRKGLECWRIFGNAPGVYGSGVIGLVDTGRWSQRGELGQAYLDASQFAYGRHGDGQAQPAALKERLQDADALIHVQDQREMDVLSGADFADAEGGFAAAAQLLGAQPALYHLDTSQPQHIKARSLQEEISLTLQSRALGPAWIAGQMRHGYAGAAALADVVDQLFAFAATTDAVAPAQFEAVFDAYLHDDTVRGFIAEKNPAALQAMAARLDEAIRRGFWTPLRNSAWGLLDQLRRRGDDAAA